MAHDLAFLGAINLLSVLLPRAVIHVTHIFPWFFYSKFHFFEISYMNEFDFLCRRYPPPPRAAAPRQWNRLVFMTSHTIDDSRYNGEFQAVLTAYRENDRRTTSLCEHQASRVTYARSGERQRSRTRGLVFFVQANVRLTAHPRSEYL